MLKQHQRSTVPIFRSEGQAAPLASLYVEEGRELSLTELAADAGPSIGKVLMANLDELLDRRRLERVRHWRDLRSRASGRCLG